MLGRFKATELSLLLFWCQAAEDAADAVKDNDAEREEHYPTYLEEGDRRGAEERAAKEDHQYLYDRDKEHYNDERTVLPYI